MRNKNNLPLRNLRVVEVGSFVAGAAMSSLFVSMGARVTKIEQPDIGDPSRKVSPWGFMNYNYGKQSVSIDLKKPEGQKILHKIVRASDVFIENLGPGVAKRLGFAYEKLSKINKLLIYCSIKGFARDSPWRDKPAFDAVAQATSGTMSLTGEKGRSPLRIGNPSIDLGAAAYGAIQVLSSLFECQKKGKGSFHEISLLDMAVYWNGYWLTYFDTTGKNPERLGSGHPGYCPHRVFKTRDDKFVFIATLTDSQWLSLNEAFGLKLAQSFLSIDQRLANRDFVEGKIADAVSRLTLSRVVRLLGNKVPCARVREISEVYEDKDLRKRGVLVNASYGGQKALVSVPPVGVRRKKDSFLRVPPLGIDTRRVLREVGYTEEMIKDLRERAVIG